MDYNSKDNLSKKDSFTFLPNSGCIVFSIIMGLGGVASIIFIFTPWVNIVGKFVFSILAFVALYLSYNMCIQSQIRVTFLPDGIKTNDVFGKESFYLSWQEITSVYQVYNTKGRSYLIFSKNILAKDEIIEIVKASFRIHKSRPVISVDDCICFCSDPCFKKIKQFIPEILDIQDIGRVWI